MMIPITRKEKYINEIVGGGNTAPETPQTREELFFAGILGEVVAPSPITRVEKYLSAIAGQYSGDLPTPITRIEYFLARAAGIEIETPIPITREEMLWNTYIYIPIKTIEGIPPLTFKAKKAGTLENYRIYGNTVDGESVGDRTANLFDKSSATVCNAYFNESNTWIASYDSRSVVIPVSGGTQYTLSIPEALTVFRICEATQEPYIGGTYYRIVRASSAIDRYTFTTRSDTKYIIFQGSRASFDTWFNGLMLNLGSTALPYEPYGYKVPVTVSDGTDMQTTTIYLDAPLAKSGNNADYIDYATQKRRNSDGTESSVTLPEIAVTAGTNTLSVGTEVQPSNVYIKYEGER